MRLMLAVACHYVVYIQVMTNREGSRMLWVV